MIMKSIIRKYTDRTFITIYAIGLTLVMALSPLQASTHLIQEGEIVIECWMTAPFEISVAEADLVVETWMTAPFEIGVAESDLAMESWMTAPWI